MKHALLSPSSAHRWLVCPGSIVIGHKKADDTNEHALLGTSAHTLLEVCLRLGVDPTAFIGKKLHRDHFVVDEEMADAVGYALDYVKSYLTANPAAVLHIEQQVFMDQQLGITFEEAQAMGLENVCWGTSDIIIENAKKSECVVIDYKHGKGIEVSVKDNPQTKLYALGARNRGGRYRRYRSVIIQPRLPGRKPVQEATITDAELVEWRDKVVIPVLPEVMSGKGERVAGDHCRYCQFDGNCKAQYELAQKAAKEEFKTNDPKALSPEQLGELLSLAAQVARIGEKAKERAIRMVHAGMDVPGWEADYTPSRRAWKSEDDAVGFLSGLGLDAGEIYAPAPVLSPAQATEVLLKKKLIKRKPRNADKDWKDPLTPVLTYSDGNPTIKRKPA